MDERRQASVKQVQFLEIIEQRSGDRYTGERWLMSDVSEYIKNHSKSKKGDDNSQSTSSFKASNQYQNNGNYNNKITDKQRQYIKVLENKTGAFFNGKTFEDAEKYIKEHKSVS